MKNLKLDELELKERFSYVKSVPFDENDLRCSGAKFQVVVFKPGRRVKPHYHKKTCEIFYILKGRGILNLGGTQFKLEKNSFFLCEPGDSHEFINNGNEDLVILIFKTNEKEDDIYWHGK